MATVNDVENCYRYILGRDMSAEERNGIDGDFVAGRQLGDLRSQFLASREFHDTHLETLFDNLVPQSIPVLYQTNLGFKIYLDLRQLHITFGVLQETYERAEVELLRRMMPDDGVLIDVGANCGYFSLAVAAKRNFAGRVIAFEPLAPLAALLEQSIHVNGWSDRIELRRMALGNERGMLPLTDAELSINAGATRLAIGHSSRASHRTVTVETLDNVAGDMIPDAIKVDIEGAEGLFLHGAQTTIHRSKPAILFEVNPELLTAVSNVAPGDLQHWFQGHGYRLWAVEPDRLDAVGTNQNIGELIGHRGMKNFLAVHSDRLPLLRDRLGIAAG